LSRRKGRNEKSEKDRPLPPLLARVGGNIEVSVDTLIFSVTAYFITLCQHLNIIIVDNK
jgi:hypothetical protein